MLVLMNELLLSGHLFEELPEHVNILRRLKYPPNMSKHNSNSV